MLAQSVARIPFESRLVASAMNDPNHPWSVAGDGDGRRLLAKVGFKVGPVPLYKTVWLRVGWLPGGEPADRLMLPVTWEAVGGPPIFPSMQGTLHVEPDEPGATRVTLNASYDPPLGSLGKGMDRLLTHRLAQVTMSDFVLSLARAVTDHLVAIRARQGLVA
jgi:hypothetical protein